jgi:hypothetical protein
MGDFTDDIDFAFEELTLQGATFVHTIVTTGSFNATTRKSTITESTQNLVGILTQISKNYLATTQIAADDQLFIAAAKNVVTAPKLGDKLTVGTKVFNVKQVDTVDPDGASPIIYKMRVGV